MSSLIYLIGYPGSGKTTAMVEALGAICRDRGLVPRVEIQPFAHTVYTTEAEGRDGGLVELGRAREVYGGTDTLSLSVQPRVLDWMGESGVGVIVGEGDRLANSKFFAAAEALGRTVHIIHLKCPEEVARNRAWARGSRFKEPWLKGRITKVNRLAEQWKNQMTTLDATSGGVSRRLAHIIGER